MFQNVINFAPEFPTTKLEMTAVADIFDRDGDGYIDYYEFVAALHPNKDAYRPTTDADKIEDEVWEIIVFWVHFWQHVTVLNLVGCNCHISLSPCLLGRDYLEFCLGIPCWMVEPPWVSSYWAVALSRRIHSRESPLCGALQFQRASPGHHVA